MSKLQKSILLATTALSLVAPAAVRAADSVVAAGQNQIEQVIVTATRREERLQNVPISITVFNQQQLSNHNVVNAADIAAYTPSMGINTDFGSQNTSFSLRGFSQDIGTQPTVGVFFADVVAPRGPSQGTAAGDGAGPGDFFDLQNVQVLKGPQGTLFGRNTTGGDVLLVPQKPTDEFGGYVQGSFGNYNMRGGQGVINIPVNDQIRLRFGIDHTSRDGYIHNTSGIGPSDFENVNYTALRASADIDLTSDLNNYTIASYTTSSTNGGFQPIVACDPTGSTPPPNKGGTIFVGVGGACGQLTPGAKNFQGAGFYDAAQVLPNPYDDLSEWRVINTTTWHVSDELTVKNIASYAEIKQSLSNPLFGTNLGTQFGKYPLGPFLFPFAQETLLPGIPNTDEVDLLRGIPTPGQWIGQPADLAGGPLSRGQRPACHRGLPVAGIVGVFESGNVPMHRLSRWVCRTTCRRHQLWVRQDQLHRLRGVCPGDVQADGRVQGDRRYPLHPGSSIEYQRTENL